MKDNDAPLLLDVSRLVWRRWTGTRQTGIDRICLAWLQRYGTQAQAVIIHRKGQAILPFGTSQALFKLLELPDASPRDTSRFRAAFGTFAFRRGLQLRDRLEGRGRFWLNPGHTGLNAQGTTEWVKKRDLRPVYLVHDLIPITHPKFCRDGEDERHRIRMRTVLDTASGIVANSAHTIETLEAFATSERRKLPASAVVWPGTPALPRIHSRPASEPTFVMLGTIEGRKNHALVLQLWKQLIENEDQDRSPRLAIVGRRGWQADDVFAQLDSGEFKGRVIETGPLDDQGLADLLSKARALLFPSFAEGYGFPLVEALAAGVPVIASDLPVFHEIGQGVPDLLPVDGLDAWRDAVCDYASEPSPRRIAQISRLEGFQAPDWEGHFAQVDAFLASLSSTGSTI